MDCFAEPVIGRAFARPVGSQRRGWGPSANTILRHCEELLRRSNPRFSFRGGMDCFAEPVIGRAFARPVGSQRRGWGPSANTILRHCEELLRRSNPYFLCGGMDCFASLAMTWRGSRRPVGRNDVEGFTPTRWLAITASCTLHKRRERLGKIRMPARQRGAVFDDVARGPQDPPFVELSRHVVVRAENVKVSGLDPFDHEIDGLLPRPARIPFFGAAVRAPSRKD